MAFDGTVFQAEDANGTPVSGAKVFFKVAGTSTDATAYTDAGLTTPASNPLVADSAGYFVVYYSPSVSYDVTIKSADEAVTYASFTVTADGVENETFGATGRTNFFTDDSPSAFIHRFRDRVFIGDAEDHTGNRLGSNGYGGTWLTENGASWFEKNAQLVVLTSEEGGRGGILGASFTDTGETSQTNIGVMGVTVNQGNASTGRAGYFDAMHKSDAGGTSGVEIQVGNHTTVLPTVNAYDVANQRVNALYIGAEAQHNYTIGDSDSFHPTPTQPCGAAIDISGGSIGASYQKFVAGIVFRDGALVRSSGKAVAISMAQGHMHQWMVDASNIGACVRSDVNTADNDTHLIFQNTQAVIGGAGERSIAVFKDDTTSAGAVNFLRFRNSRTGVGLGVDAQGTDTNIPIEIRTKGVGVTSFTSHDGSGESLRITPPSTAPTDYMTVTGSAGGGNVQIGAAGASTNIDILLVPKGAGYARFGTHSAISAETLSGYFQMRTSDGVLRKVAIVS